ncbi:hypothetical protein RchiOBHm_Chr5g0033931 [Rosa chinensis]|uniref:Uncharacterized protein n=1 Tax=Rosa chinensis TaxID=74649 RepID=A0A2P6QAU9_ROSCH|nr:hypothetical protein RchiOBHm_Chr5g0033931 [Rosa chinensis]
MNPLNWLAHPSLITCTNSKSILVRLTFGSDSASRTLVPRSLSSTTRSTIRARGTGQWAVRMGARVVGRPRGR